MSSEDTILGSSGPASSAEGSQPSQEVSQGTPEGTGASDQAAGQEQERQRASEAGKTLAAQRKQNAAAAYMRRQDALMRQNEELTRELINRTRQSEQPRQQANDAPQRDNFQSYEDYVDARAEWKASKKAEEAVSKQWQQFAEHIEQAQRQQQENTIYAGHGERIQQYAQAHPEFAELLDREDVVVPDVASRAILQMKDGPEIMMAMHREPAIAAELHKLNPVDQVAFLGRLSAYLQFKPPQISRAPAPGRPVGQGGNSDGNVAGMTIDQYYASIDPTKRHRKGK